MGFGIKLKVWGDYACFSRPEMKVERVSYDVITPSAARGILEAIHWKPAIKWVIDRIHVLNPIVFDNIRRNEVKEVISSTNVKKVMKGENTQLYQNATKDRAQRATLMLKNVAYVIEAHFEITDKAQEEDTPEKHYNIFLRRARSGQCFHQPYFGCREFPAKFELVENELPVSYYSDQTENKDLGWMLWDIDYKNDMTPKFFRPEMLRGIIQVEEP
ncbi:CRISPR-associated protein Cas5d [Desulfitispora alkaliphila]|uniref:type I-C CRISPR-associated protein Cas5c n=1 Tax=Desulfitispora alkaliphila TaxID=622674 RepID=UPI003D1A0BE9